MVESLLLTTSDGAVTGLSMFGGVLALFVAISLSVGVTKLLFNWVRSIGK